MLEVKNLRTVFRTRRGVVAAVDDVTFSLERGESLGIVGESGSGKSVLCLSIMRLVPAPAGRIEGGEVLLDGVDLLKLPEAEMRRYRGAKIAMILQDPLMSLNPVYTIGNQMDETLQRVMVRARPAERRRRAVELLQRVRIPEPRSRLAAFPHQLSGGMRQRVCAAIGIGGSPEFLIADEPTTALDVTTQAEFLKVLRELRLETGVGIIFVTHDLGIVAQNCDRVAVMYAGRIVEHAPVTELYARPRHPYTAALLRSVPTIGKGTKRTKLVAIQGNPPDLAQLPRGCRFAPRCPLADQRCWDEYPPFFEVGTAHGSACWHADKVESIAGR